MRGCCNASNFLLRLLLVSLVWIVGYFELQIKHRPCSHEPHLMKLKRTIEPGPRVLDVRCLVVGARDVLHAYES